MPNSDSSLIEISHQGCPIQIEVTEDARTGQWQYSIINLFGIRTNSVESFPKKEKAFLSARVEIERLGGQQLLFLSSGGGASFCDMDDLRFVDDCLQKYHTARSLPGIIALAGFMNAVFCAPQAASKAEWHDAIWGPGCSEPELGGVENKARFWRVVDILFASGAQQLLQEREHYEPNFLVEPSDGQISHVGAQLWCSGFSAGTTVCEPAWREQWANLREPLTPIFTFVTPPGLASLEQLNEEEQQAIRQQIPKAVYQLFLSNWTYRMRKNGELGDDEIMNVQAPEQQLFAPHSGSVQ